MCYRWACCKRTDARWLTLFSQHAASLPQAAGRRLLLQTPCTAFLCANLPPEHQQCLPRILLNSAEYPGVDFVFVPEAKLKPWRDCICLAHATQPCPRCHQVGICTGCCGSRPLHQQHMLPVSIEQCGSPSHGSRCGQSMPGVHLLLGSAHPQTAPYCTGVLLLPALPAEALGLAAQAHLQQAARHAAPAGLPSPAPQGSPVSTLRSGARSRENPQLQSSGPCGQVCSCTRHAA